MLKAILFDLDETLIDRRATMRLAVSDQYRRLFSGAAFSLEDYVDTFLRLEDEGRTPRRAVLEALIARFSLLGVTWESLLADRDEAMMRTVQLCAGAVACLETLQNEGYRLALVTNGRFPIQRDKAAAAGIARFFETIVISDQEGVEKPDPAIFLTALRRLNLAADAAVFVGDDPENDVRGAQSIGLKAIFIASYAHGNCSFADASVDGLVGVPAAVRRLFPRARTKDPLEGKTLEALLTELVTRHGWPFLADEIAINCFSNDPSISSSLKFLRRTPWARAKVEKLYLRLITRDR